MGIRIRTRSEKIDVIMKVFIVISSLLAVTLANQSSHQVIKHGNAPAVSHSVHKPHGGYHAVVASQPHAAPQDVHNPYAGEKHAAAVHAPSHVPVHAPVYHGAPHHAPVHHAAPCHPAPVYHPAPVHKPAPVYHPAPAYKPAPVYHPAPVHKPAPYHAPIVHKPAPYVAPVVHKPVVHPAPYHAPVHKPAPYHPEPAYDGPAVYQYGYAVADDYSKANFAANEARDGYATHGEYRVALPDGRTQIVTYSVADAYSGYVADVKYEGVAQYPEYHPVKPAPYHPAPAYKPAPHHA